MKFHVDNMTCGGCARSVTKTIQKLDPTAEVQVDLDAHLVEVRSRTAPAEIAAALSAVGYPAAAL